MRNGKYGAGVLVMINRDSSFKLFFQKQISSFKLKSDSFTNNSFCMQAPFHFISCSMANTIVETRICIDTFLRM